MTKTEIRAEIRRVTKSMKAVDRNVNALSRKWQEAGRKIDRLRKAMRKEEDRQKTLDLAHGKAIDAWLELYARQSNLKRKLNSRHS